MLEPRLVVLIPAHNEADRIGAAIEGLWRQTRKPDLIVVVTDNCTDDTAAVAASHGAEVFATRGNPHKKAGALNQAIDWVLPHLDERDLLLVQDADTVLNPWFSETATATFNRKVGAVGGVFYGEPGGDDAGRGGDGAVQAGTAGAPPLSLSVPTAPLIPRFRRPGRLGRPCRPARGGDGPPRPR